ncbi:MAG: CRISPR-associated helicase Cas3' [candidate division WOR-3 bacterium]
MNVDRTDACHQFYSRYFGISQPFEHQIELWCRIEEKGFPLLLRAPTGSGKTEVAVAPFLAQFLNRRFTIAPRLIYVLPMRVLADSLAQRIEKYAQAISPHITVKVQHGDVSMSPFFVADIVVTTLDQFAYGFARASQQVGRHLDLPAGAIAGSLVVFDEVHMYRDEFTFAVLRALMEILDRSRIPFVVMTATMPRSLEESLFENIRRNGQALTGDVRLNNRLEVKIEDQPLVSADVGIDDQLEDIIRRQRTLIILNQVSRAQKVYNFLSSRLGEERVVLLHSRFTRADRKRHEERALGILPSKRNGRLVIPEKAGVVIATQVLEAGIDFSAELLLTEIAPADALVQRAGRCARYENEQGRMMIFNLPDEEQSHLPYEQQVLERTREWLLQHPDFDIRNFRQVCDFVNATLDYRASDYEARDALVDLYECVLYADAAPGNIQVRRGKPVNLVVLEIPEGRGSRVERQILERLENSPQLLRENVISADIRVAWGLFRDSRQPLRWELEWEYDRQLQRLKPKLRELQPGTGRDQDDVPVIAPFRTYILDNSVYKPQLGIEKDASLIV